MPNANWTPVGLLAGLPTPFTNTGAVDTYHAPLRKMTRSSVPLPS